MEKEFTKADGLTIQAEQMTEWKAILKPRVYAALEAAVIEANLALTSNNGRDVMRGTALSSWIANYMVGHRGHKLY